MEDDSRQRTHQARLNIEKEQGWLEESDTIPWIQFPADWKVKVVPPHGDAVVRFLVQLPDGREKSVYYDSRCSLGFYWGKDERGGRDRLLPYWEVYPVGRDEDVGRCGADEVEKLLELIADRRNVASKFRKKPIVIEAYQTEQAMTIRTLEGDMKAKPGDWIITGIQGEQYPCDDSIFRAIYEPINEKEEPMKNNSPVQGSVSDQIRRVNNES